MIGWNLDPPPGSNQFKIELGVENGNIVEFLLETSGLGLFKSTEKPYNMGIYWFGKCRNNGH